MAERITDKLVRNLSNPPKDEKGRNQNQITYDDRVSGFGVRITTAGAKSFILNYRNSEGRERRLTIGTYPTWSVERARKHAAELRQAVDRGEDPMGEKHDARKAPTVNDMLDRYCEEWLPRKRPSSQREDLGLMSQIIRPRLGSRKVRAVSHADVDRLHQSLKATPYRANRALALASKAFSLAVRWRMRPDNPCKDVERYQEEERDRFLSTDEIDRLTQALDEAPDQKAANLIRMSLFTGARRGELLAATWDQFDLEACQWVKPGATTKQKTVHRVPLSDAAVALLKGMLADATGDDGEPVSRYLFPGRSPEEHLTDVRRPWEAIREAAGLEDVRLHDLRHTYASILASSGKSLPLIGRLLGHTQASTTLRYSHFYDDPMRAAANEVGAVVTGKKPAEVVPLRKDGAA
jgi:integrase